MLDYLTPEFVKTVMDERSRDARAARIAGQIKRVNRKLRLRPGLALVLGSLAARIHPEAARVAVGLSARPRGRLCLCDD